MTRPTLFTKQELGKIYFETKEQYDKFFSLWSNWIVCDGDPEVKKKELKDKMEAIAAELGETWMEFATLRNENEDLKFHLKDVQKNNDELEDRIERLEKCIQELYSHKKDKYGTSDGFMPYEACESKIPSRI